MSRCHCCYQPLNGRAWASPRVVGLSVTHRKSTAAARLVLTASKPTGLGPSFVFFPKIFKIILICIWILKSDYRFFC